MRACIHTFIHRDMYIQNHARAHTHTYTQYIYIRIHGKE